ncbi:MAG: DUF4276 family protein [Pseudonocardiales bacterium]
MNLEILVEERSAEHALRALLPRIVPEVDFEIRVFQRKTDLLKKLPDRLKGYAAWITQSDTCLIVDPDAVPGGTWEALEHVLHAGGYHRGGLAKVTAASEIAQHMNVDVNRSRSFQVFRDGVRRLVAGGTSAAQD